MPIVRFVPFGFPEKQNVSSVVPKNLYRLRNSRNNINSDDRDFHQMSLTKTTLT